MSPKERSISLAPAEIQGQTGRLQMTDIPKARGRLYFFWQTAKELGKTGVLDQRKERVIEAFLAPPFPALNKLRNEAGVTTREGVKYIIVSGIKSVYQSMPQNIQQENPLEELVKLGQFTPETRARMSRARKGKRHPVTIRLDKQVEELRGQGLSYLQIAEQLGRKRTNIEKSVRRLIAAGRIKPVWSRSSTEAITNLDTQVEQLRKNGLTNPQIAEQLGREQKDIKSSTHRLIAAKKIERQKPGRKSKPLLIPRE